MDKQDQKAFIPTRIDLAGLFVISFTILFFINIKQFLAAATGQETIDSQAEVFLPLQKFILDKLAFVTADLATFLFWLAVGFGGLLLIDTASFLIRLYRSDLPRENLHFPSNYGFSKKYIVTHLVVRSIALLGLIGWLACFFVGILPYANQLFLEGLKIGPEIYKTLTAVLFLQVCLYFAGILVRFLLLRRKIFLQ